MECLICYEELKEIEIVIPCKHHFHKDCLNKWLEIQNNCPYCRGEIKIKSRRYLKFCFNKPGYYAPDLKLHVLVMLSADNYSFDLTDEYIDVTKIQYENFFIKDLEAHCELNNIDIKRFSKETNSNDRLNFHKEFTHYC